VNSWRRTFITIWIGQAVSILTSNVLQMSIVWYITQKTASAALLALSTMLGFLPQGVLGLFVGVYIDRYNRKTVMIISDLAIALAGMVLVFSAMWGEIPLWLIYVVLFIRSIGAAFHTPALQAVTPLIVPREKLTQYNGFAQGFKSLSMVISPGLAAALFSIWELDRIIMLDVIGALLAVGVLCLVKIPSRVKEGSVNKAEIIREAKEGFRVLRSEPGLVELLVISIIYAFLFSPIGTLFPFITMTWFGGGVAESGTVEILFSTGMLAGSFLLGVIGNRISNKIAIILSMTIYGVCVLTTGLLPGSALTVFIGLSFIIGLVNPFFNGVKTAVYQNRIEDEYLGRVMSLTSSVSLIAMPLSLMLAGSFADIIGVNRLFALCGILILILAAVSSRLLPKGL